MKVHVTYGKAMGKKNFPSVLTLPTASWYWKDAVLQHDRRMTDRILRTAAIEYLSSVIGHACSGGKLTMTGRWAWDDAKGKWAEPSVWMQDVHYRWQRSDIGKALQKVRIPLSVWDFNMTTLDPQRYYNSVLRFARAYVTRHTGYRPKEVRLVLEPDDAIRYAVEQGIYTPAHPCPWDVETDPESTEAFYTVAQLVLAEGVADWRLANKEPSHRRLMAIVTNMDFLMYETWDTICKVTGCDTMSLRDALAIKAILKPETRMPWYAEGRLSADCGVRKAFAMSDMPQEDEDRILAIVRRYRTDAIGVHEARYPF